MQRTTLSTVILLAVLAAALVAPGATAGLAPVAAQTGECGVTVLVDGAPFWVALPCGALTPQPSVAYTPPATAPATPTRTPTVAPSATPTATPFPTPTPETWTATPTPPYCKAAPDGSYRVNIRTAPTTSTAAVGQVQVGEWVEITGEIQDAGGAWWLRIDRGWVAGWVMRVDCPGSFLEYGP